MFTFKQFSLSDSECAMKIGTDGVLLGSFAANYPCSRVLDVGTGCGLLALMIAQKTQAIIDGIEIEENAAGQAAANFKQTPWTHRLFAHHISLQKFATNAEKKYDLVVSNPPFFKGSLNSQYHPRNLARHDHSLSFNELFAHTRQLMINHGILLIIYPADAEQLMDQTAKENLFSAAKKVYIYPTPGHSARRIISEFHIKPVAQLKKESIIIESGIRHQYTSDYKKLTFDYHPFWK